MSTVDPKAIWFQTYSGKMFWPMEPRAEDVDIQDIAHSLAMTCRFNGHTTHFYSVAQHSVLVSNIVPQQYALWGLLHDAAEAYIGDMVKPLKLQQPSFQEAEARVMAAVIEHFDLDPTIEPPSIREADNILLVTERRDLLVEPPAPWSVKATPMGQRIVPWNHLDAELAFVYRYRQIRRKEQL